ncbi:cell division protein FtsK, partial [Anoxybacillus sp. LAT27]|nr:cell division protein FtsK [Anoxybacillus sp. LAT27]
MLELAIIPVLTGAAALYLGMKNIDKDEKTIQKVFKNLKIGAYEKNEFSYPKLIATEKKPDRTRY